MRVAIIGSKSTKNEEKINIRNKMNNYFRQNKTVINKVLSNNEKVIYELANYIYEPNAEVIHYLPYEDYNKELFQPEINYIVKGDDLSLDDYMEQVLPGIMLRPERTIKCFRRNLHVINDCDIFMWYSNKGLSGEFISLVKFAELMGKVCVEL